MIKLLAEVPNYFDQKQPFRNKLLPLIISIFPKGTFRETLEDVLSVPGPEIIENQFIILLQHF